MVAPTGCFFKLHECAKDDDGRDELTQMSTISEISSSEAKGNELSTSLSRGIASSKASSIHESGGARRFPGVAMSVARERPKHSNILLD